MYILRRIAKFMCSLYTGQTHPRKINFITQYYNIVLQIPEIYSMYLSRTNLIMSIHRLPYLNATLSEVMRISNVGPTTIPHRATVDTTFMGYEIKTNYMLLPNLMSVHLDEKHWGDPEVFRPERFIDENGVFVSDPWLMPFGAGELFNFLNNCKKK